jgi:hypothetical protein
VSALGTGRPLRRVARVALGVAAALTTALGVPGRAASAQGADTMARSPGAAACLDRIPRSAYWRVVVYGMATWSDSASGTPPHPTLLAAADALLQRVGERARAMLRPAGAVGDTLPPGEPALGDSLHVWRNVGGSLSVTAHRDGHVAWTVDSTWKGDSTAATLLSRALAAVQAEGGPTFLWPTDTTLAPLGPVHFDLTFVWPTVDRTGQIASSPVTRPVEPLFSMLQPWTQEVRTARLAQPSYPSDVLNAGFEGNILLQYVVDTSGRAKRETVHSVWRPGTRPLLDARKLQAYHSFVDASRRSVLDTRYEPARIGGCTVSQYVEQPFVYQFGR